MSYLASSAVRQMASPMALLQGGVPLSLLMDLVLGPQSDDLLRWERASQQPTGGESAS